MFLRTEKVYKTFGGFHTNEGKLMGLSFRGKPNSFFTGTLCTETVTNAFKVAI